MTFTCRSTCRYLLALALAVTPALLSASAEEVKKPAGNASIFPEIFFTSFPEHDRFRDAAYARFLAGEGLRSADPQTIVLRMLAAAKQSETYKALYLARLVTSANPDLAAAWANRAQLALALGFEAEAAASKANAADGGNRPLPPVALPGTMKTRPTTLADWAAALALVADDVAALEGRGALVAVRDELSGIQAAANDAIEASQRGPWATAKPVQVDHVLPNLFVMPKATPMDKKSMRGGMFALGTLALAGSTFATTVGATDAARAFSEMYGDTMGRAFEVPSELKGGSFVGITFAGGVARRTEMKPRTSGKYEAVNTPLPLLWASGSSMAAVHRAHWKSGDSPKSEAMRIDRKTKKQEWKKYEVPVLSYPRVQQLCANLRLCSPKLTLLEVMLTPADVAALAPGLERRLPDTAKWSARYAARESLTIVSAGETFAGFDHTGVIYVTRQRPTEWLTPAPAASASKK